MNGRELIDTAKALVADDKGLLAMDESSPTCNQRFAKVGIPQTEEARRAWRELIVTTPGLGECISGVILYDETIRQQKKNGSPIVQAITDAGIISGIKVDSGAKDMGGHPGEKITEGLDGLRALLAEYSQMGARYAKWRAVIAMGDGIPSLGCIEAIECHECQIQVATGIDSELVVYVAIDAPVKFAVLKLRNGSGRARRLAVTGYLDWVLGDERTKTFMYVSTEIDAGSGALDPCAAIRIPIELAMDRRARSSFASAQAAVPRRRVDSCSAGADRLRRTMHSQR